MDPRRNFNLTDRSGYFFSLAVSCIPAVSIVNIERYTQRHLVFFTSGSNTNTPLTSSISQTMRLYQPSASAARPSLNLQYAPLTSVSKKCSLCAVMTTTQLNQRSRQFLRQVLPAPLALALAPAPQPVPGPKDPAPLTMIIQRKYRNRQQRSP
jgi:hypothetical protein